MDIRELLVKSQPELKNYVYEYLEKVGYKEIYNTDQYVYAEGEIPVLLIAHLDTVHKTLPDTILFDKKQQMLWSPQGIGGDDRCGVYAILKILQNFKPYVLFPTDEEIGGIGTTAFVQDFDSIPVNFMIEIDRRGAGQSVYYQCGNEIFKSLINSLGFEENYGSFSDISILSPAFDIASVNLSAGYYNEHTKQEYIKLNDLRYTITRIEAILRAMQDEENQKDLKFDYQEKIRFYNYQYDDYSYYNSTSDENTSKDYKRQLVEAYLQDFNELTDADWFYWYKFRKPKKFKEAKRLLVKHGLL